MDYPENMRRDMAAEYLRRVHGIPCATATLAKYATVGGGPIFRRAGRFPIYGRDDLDDYAFAKLTKRVASNAELAR